MTENVIESVSKIKQKILKVFKMLDGSGTGLITKSDFFKLMNMNGVKINAMDQMMLSK